MHDPSDPRLADYRLLNDQRARRSVEGDDFFVAEGYVAIERVVDSGHRLRSVLLAPSRVERFVQLVGAGPLRRPDGSEVPIYVVDREVMAMAAGFDLHRGVVAAADRRPLPTVAEIASGSARRLAVLAGLNDAENVGLIARSARAFGVDALVLDPTCTDSYARRTVRVSMGEILHLPTARSSSWPEDLALLADHGVETWAMTPDGADDIWSCDVPERVAVLLGAEGPGLDPQVIARATRRVRIPIADDVDSLNVGHAAAVAFARIALH
ncbi:MAG: RNA methyltransferase [Actinomycetota bacterium]